MYDFIGFVASIVVLERFNVIVIFHLLYVIYSFSGRLTEFPTR